MENTYPYFAITTDGDPEEEETDRISAQLPETSSQGWNIFIKLL